MSHFFIPLKREHFDDFEAGTKTEEFRPANSRTGKPSHWAYAKLGDTVTLSYGYGKRRRLTGRVVSVRFTRDLDSLIGWRECYGTRFDEAVCIGIAIDGKEGPRDPV